MQLQRNLSRGHRMDNLTAHIVNDIETYVDYLRNCEELVEDERFADIQRSIEEKLAYAVSPFRAVELVLFASARRGA
jgi:hypothetical protein